MHVPDSLPQAHDPPGQSIARPHALLDAGGAAADLLGEALGRRIRDMLGGHVLEVISLDPAARCDVPAWCMSTGNELVQVLVLGNETRFWIRKREPTAL